MVWEDSNVVFNANVPCSMSILSMSIDSVTDEDQYKRVAEKLQNWIAAGDNDAVFRLQSDLAFELHTDAEQTLTRNLSVPECECRKPAKAVIDKVTGGIFFVCRNRACYFVMRSAEELPDIG